MSSLKLLEANFRAGQFDENEVESGGQEKVFTSPGSRTGNRDKQGEGHTCRVKSSCGWDLGVVVPSVLQQA